MKSYRITLESEPYRALDSPQKAEGAGQHSKWPCNWIHVNSPPVIPFVSAFLCRFSMPCSATVRIHVSADERYRLWLDGQPLGRGPERGNVENWSFETYDLPLDTGKHTLVALVWAMGNRAPLAQLSLKSGFLCSPDDAKWVDILGTGVAPWQSQILGGYDFIDPLAAWGTGANIQLDGARFGWGFETGKGHWQNCEKGLIALRSGAAQNCEPQHLLRPATLPPMLEQQIRGGRVRHVSAPPTSETALIPVRSQDNLEAEVTHWQNFLAAKSTLQVAPHTRRRVLLDLEDYYCAYPEIIVSGGAGSCIRLDWQEALFQDIWKIEKGHRDEIEGKYFVPAWCDKDGAGDKFLPEGGQNRRFETLWWQSGRYVQIVVETDNEPLHIECIRFHETRYPLEVKSHFGSSNKKLESIIPLMVRGLQMCAHETYMDCPYYEQLMYIGDTRLEVLTTYCSSPDSRLPRRALQLFDQSRLHNGLTQSRYPTRVRQIIAPFSLWYAAMIHDYWMWRDDALFVRELIPGVRGVVDHFVAHIATEGEFHGLLMPTPGWNYLDWVEQWSDGTPPDGAPHSSKPSGALNWQFALVLNQISQLEAAFDEPELAKRAHRLSGQIVARLDALFWDEERGLFADDVAHQHFSEHSQTLAILSGQLNPHKRDRVAQGLLRDPSLARATIYFSHYLFEALRVLRRPDAILDRLPLWYELLANGLKTTIESPEPTRSDCHGWGAHPLFHFHATLAGIRPAAPGFSSIEITPQPGHLTSIQSKIPHPRGDISLDLNRTGAKWRAVISLPDGVHGRLVTRTQTIGLEPNEQTLDDLDL